MIDDNDNNGGLQLVGLDFCWEEVMTVAAYTIINIHRAGLFGRCFTRKECRDTVCGCFVVRKLINIIGWRWWLVWSCWIRRFCFRRTKKKSIDSAVCTACCCWWLMAAAGVAGDDSSSFVNNILFWWWSRFCSSSCTMYYYYILYIFGQIVNHGEINYVGGDFWKVKASVQKFASSLSKIRNYKLR